MKIENTHAQQPKVEALPKQAAAQNQPKAQAAPREVQPNPAHLGKNIDTKA